MSRRLLLAMTTVLAMVIGVMIQIGGSGAVQLASAASACTIAAAGDIAESGGGQAKTAAIVESLQPTAVLTLGDNAYPNGSSSDYATYYDPTWGKFKNITKPAPGNHEYYTPGGTGYLNYFNVPAYYSYNLCGWHLYSLNRELSGTARADELAWFRADLAANSGRPMLAVWHEPRWTSGTKHGSDSGAQDLWAAAVSGGVKVVLSGHEHSYERLGPMDAQGKPASNGTREFVVGEGGNPGLSAFGTPLPTSEKRVQGQQGVLLLTLRSTGFDFALHQVGGAVADQGAISFSGTVSQPPAPSPTPTAASPSPTQPAGSQPPTPVVAGQGTSLTSRATEDGSVTQGSATPDGSATSLVVGNVTGTPPLGGERRAYLKFTIAGVPNGATNVRASLRVTSASNGTFTTTLRGASTSWSESSLTWANQPGTTGTKIAGIAALPAGQSRSVNVSSLISGNGTYGFVLTAPADSPVTRFGSSESATPPVVTVSWDGAGGIPVPSPTPTTTPTTAPPSPTGSPTPTPGPTVRPVTGLAWGRPPLTNPVTVNVSNSNHSLKLDPAQDYRLVMPSTVVDVGTSNLSINGGHNVVLIGGQLTGTGTAGTIRATNQTGTLHIEGLYVSGPNLQEGLQFQNEVSAVVQLENIRIDTVHGSYSGHHADLVQVWGGGPRTMRIDRLTGSTEYQAFMLQGADSVAGWDFRHLNIVHLGTAGWTMYDGGPDASAISMSSVYFEGNDANGVYSLGHDGLKPGLSWGNPPSGDFVPAGVAGLSYPRG
jgi:hypothetical protein